MPYSNSSPELLPYATLISGRAADGSNFYSLIGVYEWQGVAPVPACRWDQLASRDQLSRRRRAVQKGNGLRDGLEAEKSKAREPVVLMLN